MSDMLAKLKADDTIQRMARDLNRSGVDKTDLADANGVPRMHWAMEAGTEYYEERGGQLDAPKGTIATAILTLAFADEGR